MDPIELTLGLALAALLVYVAVYFALRQRQTLQLMRSDTAIGTDDRRFLYRQVIRRCAGSVLMVVLAAFLVGWFFLDTDLSSLRPAEGQVELPEVSKEALRFLTGYVAAGLLVFLALLLLAAFDMVATARYGFRHHKQLEQDRRAMLEAEAANLRRRRAEMN